MWYSDRWFYREVIISKPYQTKNEGGGGGGNNLEWSLCAWQLLSDKWYIEEVITACCKCKILNGKKNIHVPENQSFL